MKFGQFMSYYKRKKLLQNLTKTAAWKLVPDPFLFAKNYTQPLLENEAFEANYLYYIHVLAKLKICPNKLTDLPKFLFTEDSLKIKKGLELVSRSHFSYVFLIKNFLL